MTLKKRILSVLLTVIMVFSMVPLSVFAADGSVAEVTIGGTTTPYGDLASAFTAVQYASGSVTVKLLDDIDSFATGFSRAYGVQLSNSVDVTLDLNGHYIDRYNNAAGTIANNRAVFYVTGSAKLTVTDSVGGGEIIQPLSDPALIVDSSASLTVLSGTISNSGSGYGIRVDGGTLTVEGGKVSASFEAGICVGGGTVTVTGDPEIHGGKASALLITGESTVTLSGGTYTTNEANKRSILTQVGKVTDLLAEGFRYTDTNGLDVAITEDGQGTDSDYVIVSDFGIKYIDADGVEQKCTSFTELTEATDLSKALSGWYAVKGTVSIAGNLGVTADNTLNLILCDGAELDLQYTLYLMGGATLNIYGQSGGTGTLIAKSRNHNPGIGLVYNTNSYNGTVNIYGGTVVAQSSGGAGAQAIGFNPDFMTGKVNVTIARGLKCVKTDDLNTAYAFDNTDGTSITITKCTEHKWSYTNITADTHDQTCDLCGTTETGVAHTTAGYKYHFTNVHSLICACGKDYSTEYHTYTYTPNSDGLTHTATCICGYAVDDIEHTYKGEDEICICGAFHSATYDGKNYDSLQSAIDAAAPVGGTVTLAPTALNENVVVTDGTVTIDLGGNRWSADISDDKKGYVPLTVNGGNVTLKNGNLFQGSSTSTYETGIVINGGSVTLEEDARVRGGVPDRDVVCPSVTINDGTLILKEGAALLSGLQVPEGNVLANYLPEGTAFVKCSYDYSSNTMTVSDPQEFVPDVYTSNKITEGMVIVSHTHDFSTGTACPCGFNCDHSTVDEATGKCMTCNAQIYTATVTTADGSCAHFDNFADAWIAAVDNEGSTLKLLGDVDLGKVGTNEALSVASGTFTLDLNGFTLSADSSKGVINIAGTAKLTVKNGKITNTATKGFATRSTAITLNYGYAELENVELTGGSEYGEQAYSAILGAGTLHITDSTFNGALWVYPDALAKIELKITSATFNNGIEYKYDDNSNKDYDGLKAFFADGCMLFDENGKYIDLTSDAYWSVGTSSATFEYADKAIVKSHEHTYADGKCAECDYVCPHDSGINDREAGYFEKAICSVCHTEYGDYLADITAPTGEIKVKDRTWWQSLLNKISFGLFFKEDASMFITATDDSYSQPGFDETKHAVKIEFFVSDGILSREAVENSTEFRNYTIPIYFSTERQYVVYVRLTDHAGNVAYASTDGFEIDKTAPLIEGMKNGEVYSFCVGKTITVTDKNIDKATMDGTEIILDENGQYTLPVDSEKHKIVMADKAGNETTVWITVYPSHDFDKSTDTCKNCGTLAAAKAENGDISDRFATGDELFRALLDEKYSDATVTLLTDLTFTENVSPSGDVPVRNDLTIDLNGKTLQGTGNGALVVFGGAVRIRSSNGEGTLATNLCVWGANASLTMDSGIGEVKWIRFRLGNLTIRSGRDGVLVIDCDKENTADLITLYGGSYETINFADDCPATAEQILGKGCRYNNRSYSSVQGKKSLSKVSVIPCDHAELNDFVCTGCGMEIFLSVEANGETTLFGTFEDAIRYAEANTGSIVKLLRDLTLDDATVGSLKDSYHIYLGKGRYTLDLAGKTLDIINGSEVFVREDCDLTIADSVGGGKVISSSGGAVRVGYYLNNNAKLTITGGEFTVNVTSYNQSALVLEGGSFKKYVISAGRASCSPFVYLSDGYTFALMDPVDGQNFANEGNVEVDHDGSQIIRNVTVVPAPLVFLGQPTDVIFYLTSPDAIKSVDYIVSYVGDDTDKKVTLTPEKADGSKISSVEVPAAGAIAASFDMSAFGMEHSGQYRIRAEFNGYVLYSNTFTVTVAECEHPGYDRDNMCTQCRCDLEAAIVKDGKTTGYVSFADALAAAQTDANKDCTLMLLANVSGTVDVDTGDFGIDLNGNIVRGLKVKKSAKVNVSGGTISGGVTVAKTAQLTASNTLFTGTINCVGGGDFKDCIFMGDVSAKGSSMKLNSCEINGELSVSGSAEAEECTVSGTVTVNNGGSFKSTGGTYGNTVNAKSGGTLEIISGSFDKKLTAEAGSKLIISGGSYKKVGAEINVDFTISGGEFTNVTVVGQLLIDCLAEGKALKDTNLNEIIDGRVGIAGPVQVVDHAHSCEWKTATHEKLCGCGYVAEVDTEAPIISGIENYAEYYGPTEFTVTDANDFTVWVDGKEITLENGKYTVEPDNQEHTITATDIAGNTVTYRVSFYKIYNVTLPTGAGYTIELVSNETTVRHGATFDFIVKFNDGYSKTEDFKVLVNGNKLEEFLSYADSSSFAVRNVSEDLVITVEGVADITAPEVEVSIRGNRFKEFLNRITFGLFFKETQAVEVKARDFGSGIKKVEYLLSETAFTDKDAITGGWTELTLNDNYEAWFSIEPGRKAFIYVRVTDVSDNIAVVNSDGVVVYTDSEAITEAVSCTIRGKADASFDVRLNGNTVAALYNGTELIDSEQYTVSEGGTITLKNSYLSTLAAGEYTIRVQYNPMGMRFENGDEPAMTSVKLTVEKQTPAITLYPGERVYNGEVLNEDDFHYFVFYDGTPLWEYKPVGADDSEYTTTAPKNVGRYTVRLTLNETDTYKAASQTTEFEITPKEVTIIGVKVDDKVYDGKTEASITNVGTVRRLIDGDIVTVKAGSAFFDDKNIGAGKTVIFTDFALEGDDAANYRLIAQPASTTADITVKEITINGTTVESTKIYDGTTDAKITNAGTLSDNYDGDNLMFTVGSAAYDNKNVGTGKTVAFTGFALAGDAAGNYKLIAQPTDTTADITVKEISINGAAVEASRIYNGTTDAKITNEGTPSVNYDGENLKVAAGKAAYDNKNVGTGKKVTFSGFELSGSAAGNYKLIAQPRAVTADITVKEIKIVDTAVEASKVYDGSTEAKITEKGTFDGLIDGDKVDIVTGNAAYDDRNVGNGKTVAFYDFALSGDDAANYVLSAPPAGTTASITPKELTISDLKVKDKQYDGKNTAEIDGTPTLVGVVDGDVLTLVNGVPTFDSVKIGKNIAISFTAFTLSGDRVTVANYTLTQPSGITANIVEYVADGSEYGVNSNDWLNKDFIIMAKEGYKLSLADTANGEWVDSLTASDETGNGKLTFYVKNTETGVISAAVTENYKIDKTAPTGEVKLNERTAFQKFINTITFGLFFKDDVNVKLTAEDEASGVKSVLYFKSDRILTDDEVRAITDWTDNSDFDIEAKDMDKFVIYVRIEDNAGNVTFIGSDGATFDTTAPEIVGVDDGKTYYVTKKVAVDDENLESVTLNGEPVEDVFTLAGDTEATYIIRAVDKAGNVTEYTVYMKPISSITDAIAAITDENVKSSDAETISTVERQILDIAEVFDDGESTDTEWNKLTEAAAKCKDLNKRIADVADEITRLSDAVNGYDIDKVTSADKADIEKLIADIDTLLNGDNLTDAERAALEALKGTARALLDRIAAAKGAAEADEITAIDDITKDNVKLGDKEALEKAEKSLEDALRDFGGNYTEEEGKDLEEKLETVKAALAAIGNAEKAADEIGKLPSTDDAKLSDKSDFDRVKKLLEGLTENEIAMLGKDALGKVDALAEKIQKLAEEAGKSDSPKTGDTSNPALWIALLFISGGIVTGTTVVSKKKKRSVK